MTLANQPEVLCILALSTGLNSSCLLSILHAFLIFMWSLNWLRHMGRKDNHPEVKVRTSTVSLYSQVHVYVGGQESEASVGI